MKNINFTRCVTFVLIFLLISISFSLNISANYVEKQDKESLSFFERLDNVEYAPVTCYASGFQNSYIERQQNLSTQEIKTLFIKLEGLNSLISKKSSNEDISKKQIEIINYAKQKALLPKDFKLTEDISNLQLALNINNFIQSKQYEPLFRLNQFVCNFISFGSGSTGPFIIFPRLVPILLFPIPRLFFMWSADEGLTSCGGFLRMRGFIAQGKQDGIALGFWGIGFSVFLPPVNAYGLFGYSLFASVAAEEFIGYPFVWLYLLLYFLW
jgi:hypothetical protein